MGITQPLTDIMIGHILDRLEAAHKREMENRAIIAGVSLADAVESNLRKEIDELKEENAKLRETIEANLRVHTALKRPASDKKWELRTEINSLNNTIAKLRETLRQAIVEYCHDCEAHINGKCVSKAGTCFVQEWRKVLEETK